MLRVWFSTYLGKRDAVRAPPLADGVDILFPGFGRGRALRSEARVTVLKTRVRNEEEATQFRDGGWGKGSFLSWDSLVLCKLGRARKGGKSEGGGRALEEYHAFQGGFSWI